MCLNSELRQFVQTSTSFAAAVPYDPLSASAISDLVARTGIWRPVHVLHLDVSFCSGLTNGALQLLAKQCPSLLKINISGCEGLTNGGVSCLASYCPRLQVVLMEVLPGLDDSALQDLVHGLPSLLSLDVGSCRKLTNVSFQIVGSHGNTLKRLSAAGCNQLNDFDVEDISRCVSLLSLSLRACSKITDGSVESLVSLSRRKKKARMRGLQHLDVGGCVRLSDGGVNALVAAYASSLTHLDLRGLPRLTHRSIDAVQAHCRHTLTHLNIAECNGIDSQRIATLRQTWPELHISV